ncbi:FxLYD domain-containing protein [Streptomyces microflavus]|uniref:FxLYD domain-containing protein n=1 Tax=Streptomyces microflavus TaxID=1919 RepID=UPI0029ADA4F2|nr:FxLYD domain-containing protein [Streptomyces microflavus]MDX2404437.1 FxLYD domain-containing protein [Streptomyces microflavus]
MSDNFPPPPPEQPQPQPSPEAGQQQHPVGAPQPSPWAAPAAPPRKQRTGLIVTLAVGGGLVVAGAVVALVYSVMNSLSDELALRTERSDAPFSTPYDEEPEEGYEDEYDAGPVEPEAEEDVTLTKCTRDSLIGWPHADLKIVNGSDTTARYFVYVKFVDADGAEVTDGLATTEDLAPGESAKVQAQGLGEVPAGTTCEIDRVERDPV